MRGYLLLALAVFVCAVSSEPNTPADSDISIFRRQFLQLEQIVTKLQTQYREQEQIHAAALSTALSTIATLEEDRNMSNTKLKWMESRLTVAENEISLYKTETSDLRNQLDSIKTNSSTKENLLRLEQNFTNLRTHSQIEIQKYTTVASSIASSLSFIREEYNSTAMEVAMVKLQLDMSIVKLEAVKSQLFATNKTIESCQSELSTFRTEIGNGDVGYESVLTTSITIKHADRLIFDNVALNLGGYYSAKTGAFTVPVSGTYLFWGHILHARHGFDQALYIDVLSTRGRLTRGFAKVTGGLDFNTATPLVIAQLMKGEQVWFQAALDAGTAVIFGNQDSSYGGTLLHTIQGH